MPIAITCPSCKHSGRVPDTALGRRMKCPKCATPFLVEADGAAPLKPMPTPSVGVPATEIATEPPPPSLHQQPLPSAFDLPAEPPPEPAPAPEAPPESEPAETPADSSATLPWYYGFLDTYTRVAMVAGLALATVWLLFYLGLSVLTLVGTQGQVLIVVTMVVAAIVGFAFVVLGILLAGALVLLLVDMARNLREMRRTIDERSHGS
jgi:hypothetical protein